MFGVNEGYVMQINLDAAVLRLPSFSTVGGVGYDAAAADCPALSIIDKVGVVEISLPCGLTNNFPVICNLLNDRRGLSYLGNLNFFRGWRQCNRQLFSIYGISHGDAAFTNSDHPFRRKREPEEVIFGTAFLRFPVRSAVSRG